MPEPHPLKGVALMLASVLCFALLDATSKHLSQKFSVPLLVWARYSVHFLAMLLIFWPQHRGQLFATRRPVAQISRALLLVGVTGFAMAGFQVMPLAETTALLFITPLIVAVLAGPMLGEQVGLARWLAVIAGFGGTLLIARPGSQLVWQGVAFTALASVCYSLYQIQTRKLAATEKPLTMVFYTSLVGSVSMSAALPWIWQGPIPEPHEALLICSLALYGGTGHFLLTHAFKIASASTLAPFLYAQLIWAGLLGWLIYDQWPNALTLLGMAVIVTSGIAVALSRTSAGTIKSSG